MKTPSLLERILDPFQWDNVITLLTGGGLSDKDALELVLSIFLKVHDEPDARLVGTRANLEATTTAVAH